MGILKRILLGAAVVLGIGIFASCSDSGKVIGTWKSSVPARVFPTIPGTVSSTSTTTIEFMKGDNSKSGPVKLTTVYEMTLPPDSTGVSALSTVNATVSGKWTINEKDDDDYYLTFDKNSLSVNAISAPELGPVTETFLSSLVRYTSIDDVEVNKEKTILKFEDTADSTNVLSRVPEGE